MSQNQTTVFQNHNQQFQNQLNQHTTNMKNEAQRFRAASGMVVYDPSYNCPKYPDGCRAVMRRRIARDQARITLLLERFDETCDELRDLGLDLAHYNWRLRKTERVYKANHQKPRNRLQQKQQDRKSRIETQIENMKNKISHARSLKIQKLRNESPNPQSSIPPPS